MTFSLQDVYKAALPVLALLVGIFCRGWAPLIYVLLFAAMTLIPTTTRKKNREAIHRALGEYTDDPRDRLDPRVVAHVNAEIAKNAPKWDVTWRMLPCLASDEDGNDAPCDQCRQAALAFAGGHADVVVRHGTIDHPEMAPFVLGHEAHHSHWLPRALFGIAARRSILFFLVGFLIPGWWVLAGAVAVYALAVGALWGAELLCDRAGVAFAGSAAPVEYFSRPDEPGIHYFKGEDPVLGYHRDLSFGWNIAVWVAIGLNPHHPPADLRLAVMRRAHAMPATV